MGLEKMKEAYAGAAELVASTTYTKEYLIAKRMFQDVKEDLFSVVDALFAENQDFKDFLAVSIECLGEILLRTQLNTYVFRN